MNLFELIYILGFVVATFIRTYYGLQFKRSNVVAKGAEHPLVYMGMTLWGIVLLLPFVSIFTGWFDFANYPAFPSLQFVGAFIFVAGLWVLRSSHENLGQNFSPSLLIRDHHQLVTHGIYKHIRHPMYLSFLMWSVGQALLINNWLAGPLGIIAFSFIYGFRIEREEQQLVETFGDQYREYQRKSGRLLPGFHKRH